MPKTKRYSQSPDYYENKKIKYDDITEMKHRLPVYKYKKDLLSAIRNNQVIIITGETGCGKSTQIPQYMYYEFPNKKVACTQPRRVGAISLAQRVSEELNCQLGETVGYNIRFDAMCDSDSKIIYMTDGILLRELQDDDLLNKYGIIMIDEAHERTIQTDTLLGILKHILSKRTDLKVIISSATMDANKFSNFFDSAAIFNIPGRLYDVKIKYCPGDKNLKDDCVSETVKRIMKIHNNYDKGDILAFLPGQEDIENCCVILENKVNKIRNDDRDLKLIILPAYSTLPKSNLSKIFLHTPKGHRKVVIATNIAETSLTIEGIKFVVDCGLVKQKNYNHLLGVDQLILTTCSQAQANQRSGRAGRMSKGYCFRLYSEKRFHNKFNLETLPEIKRSNMSNTILHMKSIDIGCIKDFNFIDHPGISRIEEAMEELSNIGALDEHEKLTDLGKLMSEFPLEPILSKILVLSAYKNCSEEMLIVIAMLCVQNGVFENTNDSRAKMRRKSFNKSQGDQITLLNIFLSWRDAHYCREWCLDNYVRHSSMLQAQNIRNQLAEIMRKCKLDLVSCGSQIVEVQNCLAFYYFVRNAAKKVVGEGYRTLRNSQVVQIHPTSALFEKQPNWVVFHDIVITSDKFMRGVTKINAKLLLELVPRSLL